MNLLLSKENSDLLHKWGCKCMYSERWEDGEFIDLTVDLVEVILNKDGLAEKFFGECRGNGSFLRWQKSSTTMFLMLRLGLLKEAEDYFMLHTIFNPNNK